MPKSIVLPQQRDEGFTRLDTLIRQAIEKGPLQVNLNIGGQDWIGEIHHLDKFTLLFVDNVHRVKVVPKHAVDWIEILDPIKAGFAELSAEKQRR